MIMKLFEDFGSKNPHGISIVLVSYGFGLDLDLVEIIFQVQYIGPGRRQYGRAWQYPWGKP